MPRELWAKVYVGLRHHRKLRGRPDADKWLWTSLILEAKDQSAGGLVRYLSAEDMRGAFGIKASVKVIEDAIEYFITSGMVERVDDGILLIDFEERQAKYGDTPEAHAKRQREYKQRQLSDVTSRNGMTSPMTSPQLSAGDADLEIRDRDLEKEEKEKLISDLSSSSPDSRAREATPTEQAKVKHSLGLDRKHPRGPADIRDLVGGIAVVAQAGAAKREKRGGR